MTAVTLVTKDATLDDLSTQDYRDIYHELCRLSPDGKRTKDSLSLGDLVILLQSQYSRAMWHQYEKHERQLNRAMRNELRGAMGMPLLPPTVAEAAAQASPDAAVWSVGDGVPEHVIMVSDTPVTLYVNGSVSTVAPKCDVTEVTRARRTRKPCVRVWVPETQNERFLRLCDGLGELTWREVQEAGLQHYERMLKGNG